MRSALTVVAAFALSVLLTWLFIRWVDGRSIVAEENHRSMHKGECWIYVEKGEIAVNNGGGAVVLKPGEGTIISSKAKAPAPAHVWSQNEIDWIKSDVANPWLHKEGWK